MESTTISNCDSNKKGVKLLDAATEGRADEVVELLAQDPTLIHIADPMKDTAFHAAARAGHESTVLKMMEFLKLGHIELLEEVLRRGNADEDNPLDLALKNGHKNIAFDLALAMKRIDVILLRNKDGKNAFDLAQEAGIHLSYEIVDDVVKGDGSKKFVVMRLALAERSATFEQELAKIVPCVASVDMQMNLAAMGNENDEDFNKLFKAAETGREDVVMEILNKNPNTLEGKDQWGRTALHVAAIKGNMGTLCKMVQFIQNNSNHLLRLLLAGDHNDSTPLILALRGYESPELRPHLEKAACYLVDVEPRAIYKEDRCQESPLKYAISHDYPDLVRYMTRTDLSQSIRDSILEHVTKKNIVHDTIKKRYRRSLLKSKCPSLLLFLYSFFRWPASFQVATRFCSCGLLHS